MKAENKRQNPFFLPYGTPHDTAPFDRITLEDYEEAMMEGIRRDDEQIEKIINNPEKPTFDNTIINVDDEKDDNGYYDLLSRVSNVFFNLLSAETSDEMDALAQKMSPVLTTTVSCAAVPCSMQQARSVCASLRKKPRCSDCSFRRTS